jgi:AcrB/AcrD/AcrF family
MPKFALRYPFFIIMISLMVLLVGVVNIMSMPVDLFPSIDIPVVVVATFYSGMPPQQIEADITDTFERLPTHRYLSTEPPANTTSDASARATHPSAVCVLGHPVQKSHSTAHHCRSPTVQSRLLAAVPLPAAASADP